ncbi:MAG TPA: phenylalanine--tRNA ligase subunit beta [Oceanospirillales bacterium]|nr:phenylalanine--tRNA ligase subunit beta [Oceanospirillaceae bacterium]HBS42548.1 phenylalanine--tRNA ligase subunit beta [Oceanospirillales bacterium]|tara:strand:- start:18176 stop:20554 length:2379 start_codon:yes stop_codon:yes gene_type:complete
MKFSEQWLREWIQPDAGTQELVDQYTLAGLEVDGVEAVAGEFSGVVVGHVISREQHPDADKLSLCQVTDGTETFQIVCGAPNVRAGIKVPMAKIGAVLPGDFKIKKAKLRGVESNGMLCAEAELGLSDASDGLMELPESATVGMDFREYLNLNDSIIDIDLTPNRADCLSIAGLAREAGVLFRVAVNGPEVPAVAPVISDHVEVEVTAPKACPRFLTRVIRNVRVGAETPLWMVEKLRRSGIRSIDPVVDITNFVMLEQGQPLHAYDMSRIQGGIRVRMAEAGEKLTLLDGQEVTLTPDTLVIADHVRPLGIAGVMGGEDSGVSPDARDLVLEAAFFSPIALAGKAREYGLHTDASHRFERGVDYNLPRTAIERATQLILDICGGEAAPVIEVVSEGDLPETKTITLRRERLAQILSLELPDGEVEDILRRLGMEVTALEHGWQVESPSYRFDMAIEADLIEEVARIYGYNRLPVRTPSAAVPLASVPEARLGLRDLRRQLIARGYQEVVTYSFISKAQQQILDPDVEPMALLNPISEDMAVMRTSLWSGLIGAAGYNLKRQQSRIRLFETGLRFVPGSDGLAQTPTLSMLICGARDEQAWTADNNTAVDFFDLKGDIEALFARSGEAAVFSFAPAQHPALHPGQTARILKNGEAIGWIGTLHPETQKKLGVKQPLIVAEMDQDAVQQRQVPAYTPISRFPEMRRDLALVAELNLPVEQLFSAIREVAGEYLTHLNLFDVYVGKGIDPDRKSLALGLTWQHPSRTLTDDEVNLSVDQILTHLKDRFGATLRG